MLPSRLTGGDSVEMRDRLAWYEKVSADAMPAMYRIAQQVSCAIDLGDATDAALWKEHERLSNVLRRRRDEIWAGAVFEKLPAARPNFIDLKRGILERNVRHCTLCEWRCRADRVAGAKMGVCRLDGASRVASWFLHFGEEPPLVGHRGSGTIFFSSCTFHCVYCQNWDISQDPLSGAPVDARQLALIMKSLRADGVLNINFVGGEPTPNLLTIVEAMGQLEVNVPMLWNSNMYCSSEAMAILADVIDIWLPDFKYGNDKCALRLSKVPKYFEVVSRNHRIAQANGDMIIRHLVLPNHVECCTKPILRWIFENCPRALVNIMGQYHPDYQVPREAAKYADIARRTSWADMREAYDLADDLGLVYAPVS